MIYVLRMLPDLRLRDRPDLGRGVFPIRKVDQLYCIINQEMLIFCLKIKYLNRFSCRQLRLSQNNQYPSERSKMPTARYAGESVDPSPLGQPLDFAFSGRTAPNRFLKGAMSERLASFSPDDTETRGIPSPELINLYEHWGEGAIGLSLTGNVMIAPDQLEAPGNTVIPQDAPFSGTRFERFSELAAKAKKHGSLIVAQVSHPGRQTSAMVQPAPISASDVPLSGSPLGIPFAPPRAAAKEDIQGVTAGFVHVAEYLEKAGFDGIQLHSAHGYLLSQFLSPTTNKRTDEYGGDLKNRMRLILEIREAIAKRVRKDFIVGIKINSVEFQDQGFQPEEAKVLCAALEEHEFDFVELSGGTYEKWVMDEKRDSTQKREAVSFLPLPFDRARF